MTVTQNIYDNPSLFTAYTKLARSQQGLDGVPEWPCLREMLLAGHIHGRSFLDLGSGYGWVCRWARGEGASRVTGIDVSSKMICKAREMDARVYANGAGSEAHATIDYAVQDVETVELGADCFDVVFSSLTFHYVENVRRVFRQVRGCLSPQGRFVFSVEHPVRTAPVDFEPGWKRIDGRVVWPLSGYKDEGLRRREWLGVPGVKKYHRTIETYVTLLLESGFVLTGLKEWAPSEEDVKRAGWVAAGSTAEDHPGGVDGRHRPYFLLTMEATLHHLSDSQSIRVLFALEECGVPYNLQVYNRIKGRAPPELKELFPLGKSPILEIPATNNPREPAPRRHISANPNPATDRTIVTESRLILHYLADHYAPSLQTPAEDAARNAYFEDFAMCTLAPLIERILIFDLIPQLTPFLFRPLTWAIFHPFVWLFQKELDGPLSVMEDALGQTEWFGGRELGIADFCMIFPMDVAEQRGWFTFTSAKAENSKYPRVTRWLERTRGRDGYQRAVAKAGYDLRAFGCHNH